MRSQREKKQTKNREGERDERKMDLVLLCSD